MRISPINFGINQVGTGSVSDLIVTFNHYNLYEGV